jgi:environmental stress-induced protein Ves
MHHIPRSTFIEGLWRNGRGKSWDIASDAPLTQTGEFGWRFAIAEISQSGPFSLYGPVDRVFTLLSGDGVILEFGDGTRLAATQTFVPHSFACDLPTQCTLIGSTTHALNLFTARHQWRVDVSITQHHGATHIPQGHTLLMPLRGTLTCNETTIAEGDALCLDPDDKPDIIANNALLYLGHLDQL